MESNGAVACMTDFRLVVSSFTPAPNMRGLKFDLTSDSLNKKDVESFSLGFPTKIYVIDCLHTGFRWHLVCNAIWYFINYFI
jgi:hypothetical protein